MSATRLTEDQKLCRKMARKYGLFARRMIFALCDPLEACMAARTAAAWAFRARPDLREPRYEQITPRQAAWETAMGMRGYAGSPAQQEESWENARQQFAANDVILPKTRPF